MIRIRWTPIEVEHDPRWTASRSLYAYLHPRQDELLYVGKAWSTTVRQRFHAADKDRFWRDLEIQRGLYHHRVIHGGVELPSGKRMSRALLADLESMLIFVEEPWGNLTCLADRRSRPGLVARCTGIAWPGHRTYRDAGDALYFD
jgi:hypothetical protein